MPISIKFHVSNLLKKTSWDIYLCKKTEIRPANSKLQFLLNVIVIFPTAKKDQKMPVFAKRCHSSQKILLMGKYKMLGSANTL